MNSKSSNTATLSNREYLAEFNKRSVRSRIPISGGIDLTHRCNLNCIHCYIGSRHGNRVKSEMSTAQVLSIIDEITEAGCLYLLITGGEPLLRADFHEIYCHAKLNGLLVTVFTNGTLITDRIIGLFYDLPPHVLEISIYGSTALTYEKITGIEGSFERCISGIRRLLDSKINVRLKTILMSHNSHEFYDMEKMAREFGVKFRFDAAIFPCVNGNKSPLSLRVPPDDAVMKEFSDKDRAALWKKYLERAQHQSFPDSLYSCGAGVTGFHIDPYGNLKPCLMINDIAYDLLGGSFQTGWQDVISRVREKKESESSACYRCAKKNVCGFCPAFFKLETGCEDVRSEYLCEMGRHRFEFIRNDNMNGVQNAG